MLEIPLDTNYYIVSDERNYILATVNNCYNKDNSKSKKFIHVGFFNTIEGLINSYINLKIRSSNCKTIQELQEFVKVLCAELRHTKPLQIIIKEGGTNE